MNEVKATHVTPQGQQLLVVHGDITRESVDAVVNAANGWLAHGGGVAGAILRRAGFDLQLESDAWVERHGKVPTGGVAVTAAGMLPAKKVIHAVGPVWHGGDSGEVADLRAAIWNSLDAATKLGARSMSVPAISSGIFGFPKERCASVLVETTLDYFAKTPATSVDTVRFTNFDAPTVEIFLAEFARRFAGG